MKILNKLFPEVNKTQQIKVEPKKAETKYSLEEKKIQELFEKNGEQLTPEKMEEVKEFLSETEGTLESKLETLQKSMDKDIEITKENLQKVHHALTSDAPVNVEMPELPKGDFLQSLPKEVRNELKALMDKGLSFEEAVKVMVKETMTEAFNEAVKVIQSEVEGPEMKVPETSNDYKMNEKPVETAKVKEPETDLSHEEIDLIEEVFEALGESLDEVAEFISPHVEADFFTKEQPAMKMVQVTMTEKMAETKKTFDMYQKAVSNQLNQIIEKPESLPVKEVLSQVIDKLDHIIMKTDVPLYTDIKTERDLLQSSGELELARNLLDQDLDKAMKIIKDVKDLVDRISYKPVKTKMFAVSKQVLIENLYEKELIKSVPLRLEGDMKSSPRAVLETFRSMGLNHEAEVSERLNKFRRDEKAPANLKMILLKLEESATERVQAKETLDNLTGQQLLNKLEIKSNKQQMTFNVPISLEGEVKNIKVHVNAKKDRQKIDWKNSRLYFVIHLNKLGDTGVLVDVNNANVNITIKNDRDDIEKKMKPFVSQGLKRLEEVGFTASSIKYQKLNEDMQEEKSKDGFEVTL
ncbi:hypothetical protein EZV73_20095 [Acidaminobacter sp. JC074]|uniref:hypothetical protein n=1 Tax=Acidaminobacter sp. JC074 TaxID=2530199 RepID=UPI001F0D3CFC|nr:hypothetical protein [Acidaminobacter sp. JC074]MCH4889892.1 hypothetical protein [Acidaminobacter sp. JC074]